MKQQSQLRSTVHSWMEDIVCQYKDISISSSNEKKKKNQFCCLEWSRNGPYHQQKNKLYF